MKEHYPSRLKYFYEKDDVISLDLKERNIRSFNQLLQILKDCKSGKPFKDTAHSQAGTEELSVSADAGRKEAEGKVADQGAGFKTTVETANQIFLIANDTAEEIVKLIRDNPGIVGCLINVTPGGVEINIKRV